MIYAASSEQRALLKRSWTCIADAVVLRIVHCTPTIAHVGECENTRTTFFEDGESSSIFSDHRDYEFFWHFFFFRIYRRTMTLNEVKKRFRHLSRCRLSNRASTKITRSILSNDRTLKEWNSYLEFLSYHTCNTYYITDNIIYYYEYYIILSYCNTIIRTVNYRKHWLIDNFEIIFKKN